MELGGESGSDREQATGTSMTGGDGGRKNRAGARHWRETLAASWRKRPARGAWIGLGIGLVLFLVAIGAVWIERHHMLDRIEALENELAAERHDREAVGSALRSEVERSAEIESLVAEIRVVSQSVIAQIETLDRLTSRALLEAGSEASVVSIDRDAARSPVGSGPASKDSDPTPTSTTSASADSSAGADEEADVPRSASSARQERGQAESTDAAERGAPSEAIGPQSAKAPLVGTGPI